MTKPLATEADGTTIGPEGQTTGSMDEDTNQSERGSTWPAARHHGPGKPAPSAGGAKRPAGTQDALLVAQPDIADYIVEETGAAGLAMAHFLEERGTATDIEILESHGDQKANAVRRVLYCLQDARVADYVKDTGPRGWETFTWRLCLEDVRDLLAKRASDELRNARKQLAEQAGELYFACAGRHRRMGFATAVDVEFACPVCHQPMATYDNSGVEAMLARRIGELAAAEA